MGFIVVGVDGSEGATLALEYAIKEAALRGAKLRLVSAWEIPASVLASVVAGKEFYEEFRDNAVQVARDAAALVDERDPSVEHEEMVVEGQAAKVLLENSADADLMVVGRRGRGTFRDMMLGSISRHVVAHAKVPLVIIPSPMPK
jgi:nucleotide-binding universal stress UspA family protein